MPEPTWMTNIQHDRRPKHPGEPEGFIELRRPRVPGPETRYQPRPAPTITMFASEIRTQPREPDRVWLKPEDLQRGTARSSAKRRRNAKINQQAVEAMRRIGAHEEESE